MNRFKGQIAPCAAINARQWVLRRQPKAKIHRTETGWEVRNGKTVLGTSDWLNTTAWEAAVAAVAAIRHSPDGQDQP